MKMGHPTCKGNIVIENDVWIGSKSIIMSGVQISSGAVVGAGSVVTKDVSPYSIVAGNPARVVKKRFTDEQIKNYWISLGGIGHRILTKFNKKHL